MSTTQNVGSVRLAPKLPRLNLPWAEAISKSCPGPSGIVKVRIAAQAMAPAMRMMPWMASVQTTAAIPPSRV